jgi:hypothetical protein
VGGTGLEPVTPSLSTRSSVRTCSLMFDWSAWLCESRWRANTSANANEPRALPLLPRGAKCQAKGRGPTPPSSGSVMPNTECGRPERAGERQLSPTVAGQGIKKSGRRTVAWSSRRKPAATSSARYCSKLLRTQVTDASPYSHTDSPSFVSAVESLSVGERSATAAGFWDAGVAHTEAPANFPHV